MLHTISIVSLVLSVLSYLLFAYSIVIPKPATDKVQKQQQGAVADASTLAEALAKLIDGLNKSSPTLLALLASLVFMGVAIYAEKEWKYPSNGSETKKENVQGQPDKKAQLCCVFHFG